ncbi:Endopolyphosphatase [Xylariaceae sp. FL1272]|nr:Endopolyphosphatase [Xylariaceae sp. FL1272]
MKALRAMRVLQPALWLAPSLFPESALSAPVAETQFVLHAGDPGSLRVSQQDPAVSSGISSQRSLRGRFLHITDLHPDEYYKPHSSTAEDVACHRGHGPAGTYGAETSDCDSPMALVNATLDWVREHLRDQIDFVVWTGDSARHDSDEELPRHDKDIVAMNGRIADAFVDTFSDEHGLVVPVVPTFGNNDIYPHNILQPGPNDILRTYRKIWHPFIPEAQSHAFEFGGWFFVEVIPSKLAVFSLNTMYFFDRNAGVDDCAHPSEPGYKHFEWLRIQLDILRKRGMKAILMGHVPPARTSGKQLWDETCWQKYTLWLQQYRDVIVGSLYGHMNIDHFLLQDTKDIDLTWITRANDQQVSTRQAMEDDMSIASSADYLRELRDDWAKLPDPIALSKGFEESNKGKKGNDKFGGPWAERYQLSLIGPSIVPNYFPSLRVFEYNISGLEEAATWVDSIEILDVGEVESQEEISETRELKRRWGLDVDVEKKKKKKGSKGKKPKNPDLHVPDPPAKGTPPGPAYYPQTLTLTGFTQYYANLTFINNDMTDKPKDISSNGWNPGKHEGKTPQHKEPQPKEFRFEVEYSTFDDKLYNLKDLTVRSFVDLAHRIGQASAKVNAVSEHAIRDQERNDDDGVADSDFQGHRKSKKGKKKKHRKAMKVWMQFLKHAFVSTRSKEELEDLK